MHQRVNVPHWFLKYGTVWREATCERLVFQRKDNIQSHIRQVPANVSQLASLQMRVVHAYPADFPNENVGFRYKPMITQRAFIGFEVVRMQMSQLLESSVFDHLLASQRNLLWHDYSGGKRPIRVECQLVFYVVSEDDRRFPENVCGMTYADPTERSNNIEPPLGYVVQQAPAQIGSLVDLTGQGLSIGADDPESEIGQLSLYDGDKPAPGLDS